ncbi:7-cyano-7-deazaguanine synthase [Candidatus Woesearchaeota archaeon]|nr:7-cyano-7-deazaguanine synthase [Candidatus Woesearchaeota archaeon]
MKALLLLSSGIDSPVAGHLMVRQGYEVSAVHFEHSGDKKNLEKVKQLAKHIGIKKLFIINNRKNQELIANNCNRRYQCVICKRLMYRIAEAIAKKENIENLLTGENLAQVASQTLTNMVVLNKTVKIRILRPLLGFDKTETMKIARQIGTYEISIQKSTGCPFVPHKPITQAKLKVVEQEESKLNLRQIIENNLKSVEIIRLGDKK